MKILIINRQKHRSLNREKITKTAGDILSILNQHKSELSIMFVGDRKMAELNASYRGKNKSTDVLSFEAAIPIENDETERVLGDVVINVPRAELQAEQYGTVFYNELYRLLIHGTLHLLGYEHEGSRSRARTMRKKEQELYDAVKEMD